MELVCKVQNYDWGQVGSNSMVAKLISGDPEFIVVCDKPYAELWMGTHPNGPSIIKERDILLSDYIKDNLDAIGPTVLKEFGVSIPFLFKVLSIKKALSVQTHPNKEHAKVLNEKYPDLYKDSNHKPELAIALSDFKALCGFRPVIEIKKFIQKLPELSSLLSQDNVNKLLTLENENDSVPILKPIFQSLMTSDKKLVASSLKKLLDRLETEDESIRSFLLNNLVSSLHIDFPGDVGCWAPYFLNYLELQPGQAIFLKPNLPHAYISGDCIECMACSDNVVRAGLTPKHIDVTTLVEMLDYTSYTKDQLFFSPQLEDPNSCIWRPPVPDFAVVKIRVEGGESYNTINRASPSIILIMSGTGEICDTEPIVAQPGVVVFLKASRQLSVTPKPNSHLEAYQAICNV